MRRFALIVLLTSIFVFTMSAIAFALSVNDIPAGEDMPSDNITRITHNDDSLRAITYYVSSTGATSGTRYRTSAITINVGGQTAVIDISSLGTPPAPGEKQYTLISVTQQDIIKALPNPNDPAVIQALNNPDSIHVGAHIQIYNAGTGQVLATITNKDDVAPIAGSYGFGNVDITQMESRWKWNIGTGNPVDPDPEPEGGGRGHDGELLKPGDKGYGVRPSVLIDDDDPRYNPTSPKSADTSYR